MYPFSPPEPYVLRGRSGTLAEHLGYTPADRFLIINADDLGLTAGINRTIADLYAADIVSSTTIMVTGGEYRDAVARLKLQPMACGVHITMTSSLPEALVGPVSTVESVASLVDSSGKFYLDRDTFFINADPGRLNAKPPTRLNAPWLTE